MEIKIDQPDGWDSEKNEKDVSDIKDVVLEFEILKGRVKCLEDIDVNGDGKVSYPEFLMVWKFKY